MLPCSSCRQHSDLSYQLTLLSACSSLFSLQNFDELGSMNGDGAEAGSGNGQKIQ